MHDLNRQKLPDDPALPHLGVALNEAEMASRFQTLLFAPLQRAGLHFSGQQNRAGRHQVEQCHVERVKYKAGQKCLINYVLQICDLQSHQRSEQRLSTRLFPQGESRARYHKALAEPLVAPQFGQPVMHLPELEMVLWSFPNDRKISGAASLMALPPDHVAQLRQAVAEQLHAQIVEVGTPELVHYVPEHTCTARLQMTLQPREKSAEQPCIATLFGKAYYSDEGAESWRLMRALWKSEPRRRGQLKIAQPIAYLPEERILWQHGLNGRTLLTFRLDGEEFATLLCEAAQTVAHLHSTQLSCSRMGQLAEWLETLTNMLPLLAASRPELHERAAALVDQLIAMSSGLADAPTATLHGDLHLQNFFVDVKCVVGERVSLIDLDNVSSGSPWRDLGSLFAGLYYRAIVDGVDATHIAHLIDRFCSVYVQHSPWPLDRRAIVWYTATALLGERVYRTLTRVKSGRFQMVDELVAQAAILAVVMT